MPWDVFVSHNRKEKPWVRLFVEQLRGFGLSVFFDEDTLAAGTAFHKEATHAIRESRIVIFVISAASIVSPWVADEVDTALHYLAEKREEKTVIPIRLEPVSFDHPTLNRLVAVQLTDKTQRDVQYHKLLRDLLATVDRPPIEEMPTPPPWPGSRGPIASLGIRDGGRAIAIGAHWDDILLGCLGTLLRLQQRHDYEVSVAILCTAYPDWYYSHPQQHLSSKTRVIYEEVQRRFAIQYQPAGPNDAPIMDRGFREKEDRVEGRIAALARSFGDCDLVFAPPRDDSQVDHAVTGALVRSHFRQPQQAILEYEVKRYTDRSFLPNIFVSLDSDVPDKVSMGDLKVNFLSKLLVHGEDLSGATIDTRIGGCDFVFSEQSLAARLLVNALDYSGNKAIRYGEVFRGRISI
jgi:LmbE family N-acetylglucosaminyl deacetylase